ncbi:translin-associated protein X-like isoform X2 [Amblyomma americanum]
MTGEAKPDHENRTGGQWNSQLSWGRHQMALDKQHPDLDESSLVKMFRAFQVELDDRNDRYEQLGRLSHDVAIESRRIIILLHRTTSEHRDEVLTEGHQRLCKLNMSALKQIAAYLRGHSYYMYLRSFSIGLQEYVRAVTFFHYIKYGRLITLNEMHEALVFEAHDEETEAERADADTPTSTSSSVSAFSLQITPMDYMFGIVDLAGELTRKCIVARGQRDPEEPFVICSFLRQVYSGFLACGLTANQSSWRTLAVGHRVWALLQHLLEAEKTCYTAKIRSLEGFRHT